MLGASWPLRTTAPVSLSTSRVLFTPNLDVGCVIVTVSESVCNVPQFDMTKTAGAEMEATGSTNTKTLVEPPDLMTEEPV